MSLPQPPEYLDYGVNHLAHLFKVKRERGAGVGGSSFTVHAVFVVLMVLTSASWSYSLVLSRWLQQPVTKRDLKQFCKRGWLHGSGLRESISSSSRDTGFGSQHPCGGSQLPVAPVPRDLTFSYEQYRHQAHPWYTDIRASKTLILIK